MAGRESEMERMKTAHSDARPPRWAEALLRVLLRDEDRESISGDLLEEYREAILPALGPAADGWYMRQVASFLFRASWTWGAILGGALVIRYLIDTLVPPADYLVRAQILTYTVMAACAVPGFYTAWRARSRGVGGRPPASRYRAMPALQFSKDPVVDRALRLSVEYAFTHPDASRDYVASLAQDMDPDVARRHIDLYVNDYTVQLDEAAVLKMLAWGEHEGAFQASTGPVFVPPRAA